jgi:hypothetical protein
MAAHDLCHLCSVRWTTGPAMGLGKPPSWIVYAPLLLLFLLLFTGLYMLVLPYAAKGRSW